MKKLMTITLATVLAMSLSATVFANYGGSGDNSPSIGNGTTASAPAATVSAATVTKAASGKAYITAAATVSKGTIASIAKSEKTVTFQAPDYVIAIDPKTVTTAQNISLGAKTTSPVAETVFSKYFDNNIASVKFVQKGAFGAAVTLSIKPANLAKLDTESLVFYSYDFATNTYAQIAEPAYTIDASGVLTFTTTVGNDIIISDKPLTLKK